MLIFSTIPNQATLFNLAEQLFKTRPIIAQEILEIAEKSGPITSWRICLMAANHLSSKKQFDKAEELLFQIDVEKIYSDQHDIKDIYARIGWTIYWPQKKYQKVIEWMEKDAGHSLGVSKFSETFGTTHRRPEHTRLSPPWRLNYAQALAANGRIDLAEQEIQDAYAESFDVKDGYIRAAWQYFLGSKDYSSICNWANRDNSAGRLSPAWRLNYAQALAADSRIDLAEQEIRVAYAESPDVKDGYIRAAWQYFLGSKDYSSICNWANRDNSAGRLSPPWRLKYAQALAADGRIDLGEQEIQVAYAESPDVKDGYTMAAVEYFSENKDYAAIYFWAKRDDVAKRLSAAGRLNMAKTVAKIEGMKAAEHLIEEAYDEDPGLKNAYAQVAWARYIPEDMAYEKVIPYFERDLQYNRLSGEWLLNYAQSLMIKNKEDEAINIVENAYIKYPDVMNGFARCGFIKYFIYEYNPIIALQWFKKDIYLKKISDSWHITHAVVLAAIGNIKKAIAMVENNYSNNSQLVNGYATIAWYGYIASDYDPQKALSTFMQDKELNRTRLVDNYLFGILTHLGEREKAERLVDISYTENSVNVGSNTVIGFCDYVRRNDIEYLLYMITKDHMLNRLNPLPLYILYAASLLKIGNKNKANELVKSESEKSIYIGEFAKSWFKRIVSKNKENICSFLGGELEDMVKSYISKNQKKEHLL